MFNSFQYTDCSKQIDLRRAQIQGRAISPTQPRPSEASYIIPKKSLTSVRPSMVQPPLPTFPPPEKPPLPPLARDFRKNPKYIPRFKEDPYLMRRRDRFRRQNLGRSVALHSFTYSAPLGSFMASAPSTSRSAAIFGLTGTQVVASTSAQRCTPGTQQMALDGGGGMENHAEPLTPAAERPNSEGPVTVEVNSKPKSYVLLLFCSVKTV